MASHHQPKSRYRGVYRCGKRWKAQLQSQGVQFYLGTFDTEEEAAKAYDRKARDEKGEKSQTNFDDFGSETGVCQLRGYQDFNVNCDSFFSSSGNVTNTTPTINHSNNCYWTDLQINNLYLTGATRQNAPSQSICTMWERLNQLSMRLLLACATRDKLEALQHASPDEEKQHLVQSLLEEIVLLGLVKAQLEEAIASCLTSSSPSGIDRFTGMLIDEKTVQLPSHAGRDLDIEKYSQVENSFMGGNHIPNEELRCDPPGISSTYPSSNTYARIAFTAEFCKGTTLTAPGTMVGSSSA